jgi:hypothetical protein
VGDWFSSLMFVPCGWLAFPLCNKTAFVPIGYRDVFLTGGANRAREHIGPGTFRYAAITTGTRESAFIYHHNRKCKPFSSHKKDIVPNPESVRGRMNGARPGG